MPLRNKKILFIVFLIIFLDLLGVGIIIPILPSLFSHSLDPLLLFGQEIPFKTHYILYGLLIAIYSFGRFFSAPILGDLSDIYGRRRVLIISLLGTVFGYLLFAWGIMKDSLEILFLSRLIDGITGGNISTAQAVIADISDEKSRAKNFGLVGAAFGLGFILGPFVGGILSDNTIISWFSNIIPFIFSALLSLLAMFSAFLFLPETAPMSKDKEFSFSLYKSVNHLKNAFTNPNLKGLFLISFLFTVGFGFYSSFFAIYLSEKFYFSAREIGIFFAYSGIFIVLTQIFITPFVAKRWSEEKVLRVSLLTTALAVLLYLLPSKEFFLYFIPPFSAIWVGLTMSNFMSLLSKKTDPKEQGEVLGINASMQAAGEIIPPLLAGFSTLFFTATAPMVLSSLTLVLAYFVFKKFNQKAKSYQH